MGRGECDGETNWWFHTASGDKRACFHGFLLPVTWVTVPNRDTSSCTYVSNRKTHSKLGPQVCSNQGQGRPWEREQGRRKGQREPSMPACPLPPVMSPGMAEEEATEKGRQPHQAALAEWWPREAHSPSPGNRGLRQGAGCFLLCVPTWTSLCVQLSPELHYYFFNEMWSPYVARLSLNSLSLPEQLKCWDWWVCSTSPG